MQRDYIKYNRNIIGKPEIFGFKVEEVSWLGGGDEHGQVMPNNREHDEEDHFFEEEEISTSTHQLLCFS